MHDERTFTLLALFCNIHFSDICRVYNDFFLHRTTHATSVISFTARTVVLLMRVILPTFYESSKSSVVNCGVGFALQERILKLAYLTYTLVSHRKAFFEVPTLPKIESMPCGFPHDLVAMLHA